MKRRNLKDTQWDEGTRRIALLESASPASRTAITRGTGIRVMSDDSSTDMALTSMYGFEGGFPAVLFGNMSKPDFTEWTGAMIEGGDYGASIYQCTDTPEVEYIEFLILDNAQVSLGVSEWEKGENSSFGANQLTINVDGIFVGALKPMTLSMTGGPAANGFRPVWWNENTGQLVFEGGD